MFKKPRRKKSSVPRLLVGMLLLVIVLVGMAAGYALLATNQDLRQQAGGPNCGAITNMAVCGSTIGCKPSSESVNFNCADIVAGQCGSGNYTACQQKNAMLSARCVDWQSTGVPSCPEPCKTQGVTACPAPALMTHTFWYEKFTCEGGAQSYSVPKCVDESITCQCNLGQQSGASGPATCTRESGATYQITSWPGCKAAAAGGGSGASCPDITNREVCLGNSTCDWHGCLASSTVRNVCVPKGHNPCNTEAAAQMCGQSCHGQPTEFCKGIACINGVCYDPTVCGGGGGTGGGGTTTIPTGPRSVVGAVKCEALVTNDPAFAQPYPISGLSVQVYEGGLPTPGAVLGTATTGANGIFYVQGFTLPQGKTKFSVVPSKATIRDASFSPTGGAIFGCAQTTGYSLCDALQVPIGQTKAGFNFKTVAQASGLAGRNLSGTTDYEFSFQMAKDTQGGYIQRYVVRLDNKETPTNVWAPGSTTNSDYHLTVPTSIGSCSTSTGRCTITKAQLARLKPVKNGEYGLAVNPIANTSRAGEPSVELCRNQATFSVPVAVCSSGLNCVGYFGVIGAKHCLTGNGAPQFCCPAGKRVQNGSCK